MSTAHGNISNSFKNIKQGISAAVTMDSFRVAAIDGNAFEVVFTDITGIVSGVSYYYYIANTSTDTDVWLRPIKFDEGPFLVQIVKSGLFAVGGTTYNPSDYTVSPTYDAIKLPSRNLNTSSTNLPVLQAWFQNALGAITWTDTDANKLLKTVWSEAIKPKDNTEVMSIIKPGDAFMCIFTNFGNMKHPYGINVSWSEV